MAGTPASSDEPSAVAVLFSGYLGVVVPGAGATARRHLVEPLGASVFVAGQYEATDGCAASGCEVLWLSLIHISEPTRPY